MKPRTSEQSEQGESLLPTSEKASGLVDSRYQQSSKWQWISTTCVVVASVAVGYIVGFGCAQSTNTTQYGLPSKYIQSFVWQRHEILTRVTIKCLKARFTQPGNIT